eukprot:Amastigsp_a843160_36.p5 type:complete len:156 gc:universal Amastigsp_a843160_36:1539-1072(-)
MNIIFDLLGEVVVDDVANVRKVEALGRYVRRNEHVPFARLEEPDRFVAFVLTLVTVHGNARDPFEQQEFMDPVHVSFGGGKDDDGRGCFLKHLQQVWQPCLLPDHFDLLYDVQRGSASAADVDNYRAHKGGHGEGPNLGRHRSRKQHGLALRSEE